MNSEFSGRVFGVFDTPINRKRITDLENRGGEVFRLPAPSIGCLDDDTQIIEVVRRLNEFDWIFFSDIYCVDILLEVLEENEIDLFELDNLTVCAFGEAVVDRLRFSQVHSDLIPSKLNRDAVMETIRDFVSGTDELDDQSALFLSKAGLENPVAGLLGDAFEEFVGLEVYRSDGISSAEIAKIKTLLKGGAFDEIVCCSEEDVQNLLAIVGVGNVTDILSGIEVSSSDARVFQSLRENDLNPRFNPAWC